MKTGIEEIEAGADGIGCGHAGRRPMNTEKRKGKMNKL